MIKQISVMLIILISATMNNAMDTQNHCDIGWMVGGNSTYYPYGEPCEKTLWCDLLGLSANASDEVYYKTRVACCENFGVANPELATIDEMINVGIYYCKELGISSVNEIKDLRLYINNIYGNDAQFLNYYNKLSFMASFTNIKNLIEDQLSKSKS